MTYAHKLTRLMHCWQGNSDGYFGKKMTCDKLDCRVFQTLGWLCTSCMGTFHVFLPATDVYWVEFFPFWNSLPSVKLKSVNFFYTFSVGGKSLYGQGGGFLSGCSAKETPPRNEILVLIWLEVCMFQPWRSCREMRLTQLFGQLDVRLQLSVSPSVRDPTPTRLCQLLGLLSVGAQVEPKKNLSELSVASCGFTSFTSWMDLAVLLKLIWNHLCFWMFFFFPECNFSS